MIVRALEQAGRNEEALRASYEAGGKTTTDPEQRPRPRAPCSRSGSSRKRARSAPTSPPTRSSGRMRRSPTSSSRSKRATLRRIEELIGKLEGFAHRRSQAAPAPRRRALASRQAALARQAANGLDEDRRSRGGDVLLLLARIEMADGNDDAAARQLAQARSIRPRRRRRARGAPPCDRSQAVARAARARDGHPAAPSGTLARFEDAI